MAMQVTRRRLISKSASPSEARVGNGRCGRRTVEDARLPVGGGGWAAREGGGRTSARRIITPSMAGCGGDDRTVFLLIFCGRHLPHDIRIGNHGRAAGVKEGRVRLFGDARTGGEKEEEHVGPFQDGGMGESMRGVWAAAVAASPREYSSR